MTITTPTTPKMGNTPVPLSVWICFVLAGMTMAVTCWFIVEGVNSTEPDSTAKMSKIAAGVLLLILEVAVFGLAGKWPEHKTVLRALGWSVLVLEIALMSIAQISIGMTASKSSTGGVASITGLENKEAGARENAKRLQARADELRASGLTANIKKAALEEQKAVKQTAIADAAGDDARKMRGGSVGTPISEIIGQTGLFILSCSMSLLLSLAGICLMHVAGCLWRKASGELPIDQQILALLHRIHGGPAPASFKVAESVAPKNASTGLSYSSKAMAGAGLLAATAAPMVHAAPAVPSPAVSGAGASEVTHTAPAGASEVTHTAPAGASEQTQRPKAKRRHKSTAVAAGAKCDTGTGPHDGARYRRVKAAVQARTLAPGLRSIQQAEGGGAPTVRGYLAKMCDENVIKLRADGHGYELVKGGAA